MAFDGNLPILLAAASTPLLALQHAIARRSERVMPCAARPRNRRGSDRAGKSGGVMLIVKDKEKSRS